MLARELPLAPLTDRPRPLEPLRVADSPDAHRIRPRRIAARGFVLRELPRPTPQFPTGPVAPATFEGMVGETPVMVDLFGFIRRLAPYPTTALITGESGTGKELVARAIHRLSPRSGRPLVVCNCTTLTPTLVETELFGHVRGAFTGADRDHKGLFEAADGSTIFLDEVGDLPLAAQVKLLRVLEEYEIRRLPLQGRERTLGVGIFPHHLDVLLGGATLPQGRPGRDLVVHDDGPHGRPAAGDAGHAAAPERHSRSTGR